MAAERRPWVDGRVYTQLVRFSGVVSLGVLWVVASLPVVTLFPATAAMFGVVREWSLEREPALVRTFWRLFRENLRQALALEAIALAAITGGVGSMRIAELLPPPLGAATQAAALLAGIVLVAGLIFAFPIMVGYRMALARLLRAAVLIALGRPVTTLACVGLLAGACLVSYVFPPAPLLLGGLTASAVYGWCSRAIDGVGISGRRAVTV
ncbi:YesL family protein [Jiangella asiatica]|nr:DUF624 domain-containing protein [Jiangella asiatica]